MSIAREHVPAKARGLDPSPSRSSPMEVSLIRFRSATALVVAALVALCAAGNAWAAAEVHRLNLALSGIPTQVRAGDFNHVIDYYNETVVTPPPRGYEAMPKINFSWLFDGELRFAVTKSVVVGFGVSQLRAKQEREYLPALSQAINVRAELLTVPVHLGAAYYMQPYNQGDFQARTFVGGGLMSYTHTRAVFQQNLTNPDSATAVQLGGSYSRKGTMDSPGYYVEGGVHLYFASRYSVLLGAMWRSGEIANVVDEFTGKPVYDPKSGKPFKLDMGGIGLRMAAVIGL